MPLTTPGAPCLQGAPTATYYGATTTSSTLVWETWNPGYFMVSTATTITNTTTSAATTWMDWNQTWISQPPQVETQEERERREAELAEMRERIQQRKEERQRAQALAQELLRACLTEQQLRELDETRAFHVTGSSGRRWLIKTNGQSGNVVLLNDAGGEEARFCAHPPNVPDGDAWMAQKLALETDEEAFLDVANCHTRHGWRPPREDPQAA